MTSWEVICNLKTLGSRREKDTSSFGMEKEIGLRSDWNWSENAYNSSLKQKLVRLNERNFKNKRKC